MARSMTEDAVRDLAREALGLKLRVLVWGSLPHSIILGSQE